MCNDEREDSKNDHHSLKPDEQSLIVDQRAIPPITQLINPVRAPYQDEKNRQRQERHEHLEARGQWRSL